MGRGKLPGGHAFIGTSNIAIELAFGAGGCVRAALNDAEKYLDTLAVDLVAA